MEKEHFNKGREPWNKGKKGIFSVEAKKKIGDAHRGQKPWNYQGAKKVVRKQKRINGKQILNSHYVWLKENHLHRLPEGCVIHHLDGNKLNDSPENLQLLDDASHRQLNLEIARRTNDFRV